MTELFSIPPEVEPRARSTDPATSHAAAAKAKRFAIDHRAAIVGALFLPGTCYDIARRTGLDHVAVARRMRELIEAGQVRDTGKTAAGANGRECTVYDQVLNG